MDAELRRRLRAEGQHVQVTAHVGKDGLTEGVVSELDSQLRRNHLVKVRLQRGAAGGDRGMEEEMARGLSEGLGAELVERRGHTVLLYRRRVSR